MFVAVDGALAGIVAVADPVKETTEAAIKALHEAGLTVIMATGDNERTARAVAASLGIDDVRAGVLPEGKKDLIDELQAAGHKVAMAGDGVNDAPALAAAEVGIAMGTGADVAVESAGITLLKGDLTGIVRARRLAPRDDAQHPSEPVLCLLLQRCRRARCRRHPLPANRHVAVADDRGCRHEPVVCFGHQQCSAVAGNAPGLR